MKNKAVAVVSALACFELYGAGTVSYSIPVLTVKTDGVRVVPGSGWLQKCPFSYVETTNNTPVKVSIMEDVPAGAGNSMRASVWLAATTASLTLKRDLAGETISFETSGYVDGPSAGGMLCLAVMSAIEGRPFPDDFVMTGTIMADGTIGAVGGVAEKLRAASKAGMKRVCIPTFARMDGDFVDLLELGKELKLEMHQVGTIAEAYRVLHRLPTSRVGQLNSAEVCRLPANVEGILKNQFVNFARSCPRGAAGQNKKMAKAVEKFSAGLFGVAIMDLMDGLEDCACDALKVETPPVEHYPSLEHELPTNGASVVSKLLGNVPSKSQFAEELQALHRDIKELESDSDDDELEFGDRAGQNGKPPADKNEDWFDDAVENPCQAQFASLANFHLLKQNLIDSSCKKVTEEIDSVVDWMDLDAEQLNAVRELLLAKLNALVYRRTLEEGGENYERWSEFFVRLMESTPYLRPNAGAHRVENTFYRTMKSMDAMLNEDGIKEGDENNLVQLYRSALDETERLHARRDKGLVDILRAIFSEAQTLSLACSLSLSREAAGNSTFFSSIVSTARENALANISECKKHGIPCVMPVILVQEAESQRDAYESGEDADMNRFDVFCGYLEASISAKALVLCFAGRKPELNAKGYCSKSVMLDDFDSGLSCATVRYFGVDGAPILRDGFSGWRVSQHNGAEYTSWLDLEGRDVRYKTTNECWTSAYDDSGRLVRKTYCNDSWVPTPRMDGVLFETKGYDADGNETSWEFFGVSSNHVNCGDGIAIVRSQFNKRGQEVGRRFYDANGKPAVHKDGNAGYDAVYDKKGNMRIFTFLDCAGKPVMTTQGYARMERKCNTQGLEIERTWYDEQGNPVCVDGVAKDQAEYDEAGNLTKRASFGVDNRLTRDADNVSVTCWRYDQTGQISDCSYYGPDGKPTQHRNGSASWKNEFDAAGRIVGRKWFDVNGNEVDIKE